MGECLCLTAAKSNCISKYDKQNTYLPLYSTNLPKRLHTYRYIHILTLFTDINKSGCWYWLPSQRNF